MGKDNDLNKKPENYFDNLYKTPKRPDWIDKETPWMDLVVEKYIIKTVSLSPNSHKAFMRAAKLSEKILYHDILGGLQLDLEDLWGKSTCTYPDSKKKGKDKYSEWEASNWMIPPYLYEEGVSWIPYDGMQKFYIETSIKQKQVGIIPGMGTAYQGLAEVHAFVWNDKSFLKRYGCLADVIYRNKNEIVSAKSARLAIPLDKNEESDISKAYLLETGKKPEVLGFIFPPNEKGDISYREIDMEDIDIEKRCEMCQYRDR